MYEENYGTLLRDTKVDFNKWKEVSCLCTKDSVVTGTARDPRPRAWLAVGWKPWGAFSRGRET